MSNRQPTHGNMIWIVGPYSFKYESIVPMWSFSTREEAEAFVDNFTGGFAVAVFQPPTGDWNA